MRDNSDYFRTPPSTFVQLSKCFLFQNSLEESRVAGWPMEQMEALLLEIVNLIVFRFGIL